MPTRPSRDVSSVELHCTCICLMVNEPFMFLKKKKKNNCFNGAGDSGHHHVQCLWARMGMWFLFLLCELRAWFQCWTYAMIPKQLTISASDQAKDRHLFQHWWEHWLYWADQDPGYESLIGHPPLDASKMNFYCPQSSHDALTLEAHPRGRWKCTECRLSCLW